MDEKYDPKAIETKWQAYRNKTGLFRVSEDPANHEQNHNQNFIQSLTLSDKII